MPQNIYYVRQADDGDWSDNSAKDDRFFAFRTHAQTFADSLNEAEVAKNAEYNAERTAKKQLKESIVAEILEKLGIDVSPLIPGFGSDPVNYDWFDTKYEVVEVTVEG